MLYIKKPENFNPIFEIGSCFVEHNGKILLLERQNHKPQGETYGVPAGKIDPEDDSNLLGTLREIKQETGLEIPIENITYFKTVYVAYPDFNFVYHMYHTLIEGERLEIKINLGEHKCFVWKNPDSALRLPLIPDLDTCIKMYYQIQ